MRKTHVFGLAVFAVFAFSVVAASSAFAAIVPQWLINGANIALGEKVNVDVLPDEAVLLLLEDMSTTADVLCEISKSLGLLESNGEGSIETGECINPETMAICEGGAELKVAPLNLPWTTLLLEPVAGEYEIDITKHAGGGAPGWKVECLVFTVLQVDECTTEHGKTLLLGTLTDGLILGEFMETIANTEAANCSLNGGAEKPEVGLVVGPFVLHALSALEALLTLAVSLENEP